MRLTALLLATLLAFLAAPGDALAKKAKKCKYEGKEVDPFTGTDSRFVLRYW